ncbi:MAG TPA: exodeoxyribonuclease V subunit beta [Polyangiaceae bacterium]|nr:exodeoxyribonuclease V subunit beta [Polyangiaceae bacterium]
MTETRFEPFGVALSGTNVVTASAGTGKTYTITTLVVRLILESKLDVRELLVVTFTEAATAELRARIRARLRDAAEAFSAAIAGRKTGDAELDAYAERRRGTAQGDFARLEAALRDVDEASISTIHGFCHRMVRESAFESDSEFEAELVTDLGTLRDRVVHDFWAAHVAHLPKETIAELSAGQFGVAAARNLVDRVVRNPDLPVLPETDEDPFQGAVEAARRVWRATRGTFVETMERHPREKGPLKKGTAQTWATSLDQFFAAEIFDRSLLPLGVRAAFSKDHWGKNPPDHPFRAHAEILQNFGASKHLSPSVVATERAFVAHARARFPELKKRAHALSFDDLLLILDRALQGPRKDALVRSVRDRFKAALIDEFQDTDPVQFRIFDTIYRGTEHPLFLIGDPKQAIYAFRGADVFAYLAAVSRPENVRHTMDVSYRSDPGLVAAVNALFAPKRGAPPPFLLEGIDSPRVTANRKTNVFEAPPGFSPAPFEFLFYESERGRHGKGTLRTELPTLVAADIAALIREKARVAGSPVTPGDIAVLTRTNAQCFEVQKALRALRIPAVVLGDESVYGKPEADELHRVLAAIVEPNSHELRKALTTELLGVTANELARMEEDPAAWDAWANRFREWNLAWTERGFVQMFHAILTEARVQERLLRYPDGERRMTNLFHLMELLHTASKESHLGPAGLLHFLAAQRSTERAGGEAAEIRLESDDRAVKLTTIHKSKGLEYPVVYCPYLWDGMLLHSSDSRLIRFHDEEDGERQKLDLGSARYFQHKDRAELEALAENTRLLYVALTRAKHRTCVVWANVEDSDQSALFSLLHPPEVDASSPPSIRDYRGRLSAFDDEATRNAIRALTDRTGGAVGLRELVPGAGVPIDPPEERGGPLRHREPERQFGRHFGVASFSGLTAGREAISIDAAEGRDLDEGTEGAATELAVPAKRTPSVLAEFPRGAKAGTLYHSILEHLDFQTPDALDALVNDALRAAGYDGERYGDMLRRSVRDVLGTRLLPGDGAPRLSDLPRTRRLDELEFHLPVAAGDQDVLTPARLAAAFAAHPIPGAEDYEKALGHLAFLPVEGFLKGYIDLVFEHGGRFYVVDYKTNRLGDDVESYDGPALREAMAHGHYYLQYHLYTLAVHRYLGRRLPAYSYDAYFGGALYLFVKGMTPETGPAYGVHFEKPPLARVEALSRVLGDATGATR